jgi:hypothetical protein
VGSFSHYLVYLETIIFFFYTELKCLLAPLLKTYPCEERGKGKEKREKRKKMIFYSYVLKEETSPPHTLSTPSTHLSHQI